MQRNKEQNRIIQPNVASVASWVRNVRCRQLLFPKLFLNGLSTFWAGFFSPPRTLWMVPETDLETDRRASPAAVLPDWGCCRHCIVQPRHFAGLRDWPAAAASSINVRSVRYYFFLFAIQVLVIFEIVDCWAIRFCHPNAKNKSCWSEACGGPSRKHDEHVDTVCAQAPDVAVVRHCQECTFHVYKLVSSCLRQFISDFRLPIFRGNNKKWNIFILFIRVMRCPPSLSRFVTSCGTVLAQISCSPYYLYWRNPCSPCLVSPWMHLSCCSAPNGRIVIGFPDGGRGSFAPVILELWDFLSYFFFTKLRLSVIPHVCIIYFPGW